MLGIVGQEYLFITVFQIQSESFEESKWWNLMGVFFLNCNESLNAVIQIKENFVHGFILLSPSEFSLEQFQNACHVNCQNVVDLLIQLNFQFCSHLIIFKCGLFAFHFCFSQILRHEMRQLLQGLDHIVNLDRWKASFNCLVSIQEKLSDWNLILFWGNWPAQHNTEN